MKSDFSNKFIQNVKQWITYNCQRSQLLSMIFSWNHHLCRHYNFGSMKMAQYRTCKKHLYFILEYLLQYYLKHSLKFNVTFRPFTKECFVPSLIEIRPVVFERTKMWKVNRRTDAGHKTIRKAHMSFLYRFIIIHGTFIKSFYSSLLWLLERYL